MEVEKQPKVYYSFEDVKGWINDLGSLSYTTETYDPDRKYMQVVEDSEIKFKVYLYTSEYKYSIYAEDKIYLDNRKGYLGCMVKSRKVRPGEAWYRGNDLPDGNFTKENWERIKTAIIRYELEAVIPTKVGFVNPDGSTSQVPCIVKAERNSEHD